MDILIVDDSATTRKLIRRILTKAGVPDDQIGEAGDGRAALTLLESQQVPILVLCDVNMPTMSGEELLQRATALEQKHVFVMVTSVASAPKRLELQQLGAAKVVAKPFDATALSDVLAPYLQGAVQTAAGQANTEAPEELYPDDAALATLGLAALQSVLQKMAFTEVMLVAEEPPRTGLYGASVCLDAGERQWVVRLATDARAAGELSNRITGQIQGEDEGLRLDAMRELVNMVGGDLVSRTVARFEGATLLLPKASILYPDSIKEGTMRGLRLVPGGHRVWLGVEPV